MSKIVALHLKKPDDTVMPVEALNAVAGMGFEGDRHWGKPSRQVLFVSTEDLDAFGYAPGDLREQVTVDLEGLQGLPVGSLIAAGDATFEVEQDCAPCANQAKFLGEEPAEFIAKTTRRRGMLMKVREGGTLRVGDEVRVGG